jgi:2-polyprenyl-3-methyl-5-hydroxy-6-metoxy-1,4-benzoquinol methylase
MITTPQDLRALLSDLTCATWTLASLGVLFESGLAEKLREPRTVDELAASVTSLPRTRIVTCLGVAAAAGVVLVDGARYRLSEGAMLPPPMQTSIVGDIRSQVMQTHAYLDSARATTPTQGWRHTDPALLQAQGDASTALAAGLKMNLAPQLGDLATRLEQPGARMLDVGTGVAALAVALCRTFPQLSVVGLDIADAPLSLARANVARAGLDARIELRQLPAHELRDESSFDVAWVPVFFLAEADVPRTLEQVRGSLRPGGWTLLPVLNPVGDPRQRAVGALLTELWGGPVVSTAELEGQLSRAGYTNIRTLPGPLGLVVGQR